MFRTIAALIAVIAALIIGASIPVDELPSAETPTSQLMPCSDDSGESAVITGQPCYWDAGRMGNREGTSFIAYPNGTIKAAD